MEDSRQLPAACSVIIIAGDEEHNILPCLASVSWAAERIVVCSSRKDATEELARSAATTVLYRDFDGYARQKQFALEQATMEWVLSLDADERATPELEREIRAIMADPAARDGYSIPRKNHFGDTWLRHGGWYPDRQVRFFRRARTRVTDRLVHEGFEVTGSRGEIQAPMLHYTLPRVRFFLGKALEYAWFEAREKRHRRKVGIGDFLVRPPLEFTKKYLLQRGFLDGWEGLVAAIIHVISKVQVLLFLWEMQHRNRE